MPARVRCRSQHRCHHRRRQRLAPCETYRRLKVTHHWVFWWQRDCREVAADRRVVGIRRLPLNRWSARIGVCGWSDCKRYALIPSGIERCRPTRSDCIRHLAYQLRVRFYPYNVSILYLTLFPGQKHSTAEHCHVWAFNAGQTHRLAEALPFPKDNPRAAQSRPVTSALPSKPNDKIYTSISDRHRQGSHLICMDDTTVYKSKSLKVY